MQVHSQYEVPQTSDKPRAVELGTSLTGYGHQRRPRDRGPRRHDQHRTFDAAPVGEDPTPDPTSTLASTLASLDFAHLAAASASRRRVTAAYANDD